MIRLNFDFARLAMFGVLIGVLTASLGLAGCGRKGPLDPPPGATLASAPPASEPGGMFGNRGVTPIGGQAQNGDPGVDQNGQPMAPKGPDKPIFLDRLLN